MTFRMPKGTLKKEQKIHFAKMMSFQNCSRLNFMGKKKKFCLKSLFASDFRTPGVEIPAIRCQWLLSIFEDDGRQEIWALDLLNVSGRQRKIFGL